MRALPLRRLACLLLLALPLACSDAADAPPGDAGAKAPSASEVKPTSAPADRTETRGRPLPAFSGRGLDGEAMSLGDWIGQRFLLFGFNPEAAEADVAARALAAVAPARKSDNFAIVGMAMGSRPDAVRAFLKSHDLDIPTFYDPSGSFQQLIGLQSRAWLLLVDADGNVINGLGGFATEGAEPAASAEMTVRQMLRLPVDAPGESALAEHPMAPPFSAEPLGGGKPFRLSEARGRPLILMFFLHTCPHCHEALRFLKGALAELPADRRPELIGISIVDRPTEVRAMLKDDGLDFFRVLVDPDYAVRTAYGALQGVPVIFLIDAEGRIVSRTDGWRGDRDAALMTMRLAQLAGQPVPMLLHKTGYSGNDVCAVCHAEEAATWELTTHATAYDTLVRHGADADPECVSCHVVGYGKEGGFSIARPEPALEDVGCETCHGRGGPHLSPGHVKDADYQPVCVTCHDPEHSLGFDYATFLPKISHAANAGFASLSPAEKRALLAKRRKPRENLLPTSADFVGSKACAGCHPKEFATWSGQPHAHAIASLEKEGKAGDAACLACHTTGFGRPGGFPRDGKVAGHPDLASVGCESCHGPGGKHVAPDAPKRGTIVSLGDKCDSCVILQVCGSCHDEANDPGFEFEVQKKIDLQRHGTIEAGTGKPKDAGQARLPASAAVGLLERGFAAAEAG